MMQAIAETQYFRIHGRPACFEPIAFRRRNPTACKREIEFVQALKRCNKIAGDVSTFGKNMVLQILILVGWA